MLKITNYELESKSNLLIAHLSDIHYSKHFNDKRLDEVLLKLKEVKPDYICISGDIIDNLGVTESEVMGNIVKFLDDLSKISKVIIGLGNHDTRDYKGIKDNKWYEKLNKDIIVLNNTSYIENGICFYGLRIDDDYYHHEEEGFDILNSMLSKIELDEKNYNILIFHSPVNFDKKEIINNFNLVLVGHTHNGLTPHFIPGKFGFVSPHHGFYLKHARKCFQNGKSKVIISGGITKLSVGTGILHLFNALYASDINLIYLKKGEKNWFFLTFFYWHFWLILSKVKKSKKRLKIINK